MNLFLQADTPEFNEFLAAVQRTTRLTTLQALDESKDVWLTAAEAMAFFKIKSETTLAKRRDEPHSPIVCSKPDKDTVYLKASLHQYLLWKKI